MPWSVATSTSSSSSAFRQPLCPDLAAECRTQKPDTGSVAAMDTPLSAIHLIAERCLHSISLTALMMDEAHELDCELPFR